MKSLRWKFSKKQISWLITGAVAAGLVLIMAGSMRLWLTEWQSVILLQNSDEKRATGGFLGSVAIVKHQGLKIINLQYHDIYNLDSQIAEFGTAPLGVQKYLTGGRNELHLQDANWERDYPTAAKQIIALLQKAGQEQPDFVWALNASMINKILTQVGAVELVETGNSIFVTSENFTSEARRDHEIFAAERQPKTNFLRNFGKQLLAKLKNLSAGEKFKLVQLMWRERNKREWQAYAENGIFQKIFQLLGTSGETKQNLRCQNIYVVESNVGINKSNRRTQTEVNLEQLSSDKKNAVLTIKIRNDNVLDESALLTQRLHLVNYQRLLVPRGVEVEEVRFNDELMSEIDEREVIDASGERWQEIGFLVIVNEQSQGELKIKLAGEKSCWRIEFD